MPELNEILERGSNMYNILLDDNIAELEIYQFCNEADILELTNILRDDTSNINVLVDSNI